MPAARFLEVRPRSVAEVRRRLRSAGYAAPSSWNAPSSGSSSLGSWTMRPSPGPGSSRATVPVHGESGRFASSCARRAWGARRPTRRSASGATRRPPDRPTTIRTGEGRLRGRGGRRAVAGPTGEPARSRAGSSRASPARVRAPGTERLRPRRVLDGRQAVRRGRDDEDSDEATRRTEPPVSWPNVHGWRIGRPQSLKSGADDR